MKLHADEVEIDAALVARLLAAELPELAGLPIREVRSTGTVNAIYRLGEEVCVRLPRVEKWTRSLERELEWLPRLAASVSLRIPEPVARGRPGNGFPFPWAVYRWIEGRPYDDALVDDEGRAAEALAGFVRELGRLDPRGAPRAGRLPLRHLDEWTRAAIRSSRDGIDAEAVTAAWERALEAPPWDGRPIWMHADLLRPNLLVDRGALVAVLDFGDAGAGDPAFATIPAWAVFGPAGRTRYRDLLALDEGAWARGRGYALHQALLIIPYYAETNPEFVALAKRTVEQVLGEGG
jgi:aminoglycoside phosphotransferase (APT) family kinase protein